MIYHPHRWLIIRTEHAGEVYYKVFASFYGGYAVGDSWKLNSGITRIERDGEYLRFEGYSGSVYVCHQDAYGASLYAGTVLHGMEAQAGDNFKHIPTIEEALGAMAHLEKAKDTQ